MSVRAGRTRMAGLVALAATLAGAWMGTAAAHGNLVRGSVTLAPDPPRPGQPMVLTIDLAGTNDSPVEGAKLVAELKPAAPTDAAGSAGAGTGAGAPSQRATSGASTVSGATPDARTIPLQEYEEPYGTYRAELAAPPAGSYTLIVHDRTDPGEDATADIAIRIGGNVANGSLGFTFPGGAGTSQPITTWLIWLVGVPLAVGIAVWVLVRRTSREDTAQDRDEG